MNHKSNNFYFCFFTIISSSIILGFFLWLCSSCLWIGTKNIPEWTLNSFRALSKSLLFSHLIVFSFWLFFGKTISIYKKLDLTKALCNASVAFIPLFFLLLPLLSLNDFLNSISSAFLYFATDLNYLLLIYLAIFVFILFLRNLFKEKPLKLHFIKNLSEKSIKLILFFFVFFIYLISKQNIIPFGAENEERFKYFTGDEPQYCLIAHSLIFDKDYDLKNNLDNNNYRHFYPHKMTAHGLPGAKNQDRYSYHRLGTSILIAPAYYLGHLTRLGERQIIVIFLNLLGAFLALIMFSSCIKITKDKFSSFLVTLTVSLSVPLIFYTHMVYPEMIAGLLILYVFTNAAKKHLASSLCIAFIPWLHERFAPVTLVLVAYLFYSIGWNKKKLLYVLIPLFISALFQMLYYQSMYGIPMPIQEAFVEGSYDSQFGFFNKSGLLIGLLGLFFDSAEGLFIYSPIFMLSLSGIFLLFKTNKANAVWFTLIFLSYYIPVGIFGFWWGGGAPPPRFLVSIIPLLSIPLALALSKLRSLHFRYTFFILSALSIFSGLFFISHPAKLFNFGSQYHHFFPFSNFFTIFDLKNILPSCLTNIKLTKVLLLLWFGIILSINIIAFLRHRKKYPKDWLKPTLSYITYTLILFSLIVPTLNLITLKEERYSLDSKNLLAFNFVSKYNEFDLKTTLTEPPCILYEAETLKNSTGYNVPDIFASSFKARFGNKKNSKIDYLVFGPYVTLPKGKYKVSFFLKTDNTNVEENICTIDISGLSGSIIFEQNNIKGTDFTKAKKFEPFIINLDLKKKTENIEFRVFFLKKANLWIDCIKIDPYL